MPFALCESGTAIAEVSRGLLTSRGATTESWHAAKGSAAAPMIRRESIRRIVVVDREEEGPTHRRKNWRTGGAGMTPNYIALESSARERRSAVR
jgi:hypothetical protein